MSNAEFINARGNTGRKGVLIGVVDEAQMPDDVISKYVACKAINHTKKQQPK